MCNCTNHNCNCHLTTTSEATMTNVIKFPKAYVLSDVYSNDYSNVLVLPNGHIGNISVEKQIKEQLGEQYGMFCDWLHSEHDIIVFELYEENDPFLFVRKFNNRARLNGWTGNWELPQDDEDTVVSF